MTDNVQRIKEKLDIVEYLKPIVHLTPGGKNLKGLCPFHKEKTPSFMVSPERQIWRCFGGCNTGGDIFSFVMKYENVEFYDALKLLAERAGIELQRDGGEWQKYNRLYEINEAAAKFFRSCLTQSAAEAGAERARTAALAYCANRGMRPETMAQFEVGLAPAGTDVLVRYLTKSGYAIADIERAGLAFRTERGTYWDRFRQRLMFPLKNAFGKTVGFTGRVLEGSETSASGMPLAKYVNSPETPVFQKSKLLYGFHATKNAVREAKSAVLVEGQMDFLMAWQDGVQNAVGTSGTALTDDHLTLLKRAAEELVLVFDNDAAGQAASERSIELAFAHDLAVKVVVVPESFQGHDLRATKDPADIARAYPGALGAIIAQAVPAMTYYFHRYPVAVADIYQRKRHVRALLAKLQAMASAVERATWLKELARASGLDEKVLLEEMASFSSGKKSEKASAAPVAPATLARKDHIARRLCALAYHEPRLRSALLSLRSFFPRHYLELFEHIVQSTPLSAAASSVLDELTFQNEGGEHEFLDLARQLQVEYYRHRQRQLKTAIQGAERTRDEAALAKGMAEFDIISREIHTLNTYRHEQSHANQSEEEGEACDVSEASPADGSEEQG